MFKLLLDLEPGAIPRNEVRVTPPAKSVGNRLLRLPLTAAHQLLKLYWRVRRPRTFGAHALALTSAGKVVMVKLRYAPGWRLPGGGRAEGEAPAAAVLRELEEEIGLTGYARVRLAAELNEEADFKQDLASLLIVDDVRYSPPYWSWEVEQVQEFPLDSLPQDMSPRAIRWIEAVRPHL